MKKLLVPRLQVDGCCGNFSCSREVAMHHCFHFDPLNKLLGIRHDLESVLIRIRVVPVPGTQTPMRGMRISNHHGNGGGKTALLRYIIPYAQMEHNGLSEGVVINGVGPRLWKLVMGLLHDGYSVILSNVKVIALPLARASVECRIRLIITQKHRKQRG